MTRQRMLPARLTPVASSVDMMGGGAPVDDAPPLKDDLIYGVEALRAELHLRNTKQVYHLRERSNVPIFMMEGVGLCARRSALRLWVRRKEEEALKRHVPVDLAKGEPAS